MKEFAFANDVHRDYRPMTTGTGFQAELENAQDNRIAVVVVTCTFGELRVDRVTDGHQTEQIFFTPYNDDVCNS
jgi:hypothetical protein